MRYAIIVVPNRGRDIGALLTGVPAHLLNRYDVIGHIHGKRSLAIGGGTVGENWREFLWQNLIGDRYPMMDVILDRFAKDGTLGMAFPEDPSLCDWDGNREIAESIALKMGFTDPLPPFFNFPVGAMLWARTDALRPLFELKLGWDDYPKEPLPFDGTILHALERLFPFIANYAGYQVRHNECAWGNAVVRLISLGFERL